MSFLLVRIGADTYSTRHNPPICESLRYVVALLRHHLAPLWFCRRCDLPGEGAERRRRVHRRSAPGSDRCLAGAAVEYGYEGGRASFARKRLSEEMPVLCGTHSERRPRLSLLPQGDAEGGNGSSRAPVCQEGAGELLLLFLQQGRSAGRDDVQALWCKLRFSVATRCSSTVRARRS